LCTKFDLQNEEGKIKKPQDLLGKHLRNRVGFRVADFVHVPTNRNLPRVIEDRKRYASAIMQDIISYNDAIFIDETGFNSCTTPTKGRSIQGSQPVFFTDKLQLPNVSVIAAASKHKVVYDECWVGSVNGAVYAQFLTNLFEKLDRDGEWPEGKKLWVISDNCSIHKEKKFVKAVEVKYKEKAHFLYLPPYSPFLDPIEEVFAFWKFFYTRALVAGRGSTVYGVAELIRQARQQITPFHCGGAFRHAFSFVEKCLRGVPICGQEIIDSCHDGDEVAAAKIHLFGADAVMARMPEKHRPVRKECDIADGDAAAATDTMRSVRDDSGDHVFGQPFLVCGTIKSPPLDATRSSAADDEQLDVDLDETMDPDETQLSDILPPNGDDAGSVSESDRSEFEDDTTFVEEQ
jgi:hypothetical protein